MAIALDSTSSGSASSGTTVTVSHTCAAGALLVVSYGTYDNLPDPSCTYNGDAMTLVVVQDVNNQQSSGIFVLTAPASGTHNIVLTKSNGVAYGIMAVSYTGAGGYSATAGASASSSSSASVTVNTATTGNGYVVAGGGTRLAGLSLTYTGAGTQFANFFDAELIYASAYTAFTAGSDVTQSWTLGAADRWSFCGVEIYEAAPTTSIKTVNGLAYASIKTVDDLAIASVKTVNGLA